MSDDNTPALTKAIFIWKAGRSIPLTLFAQLCADGYDVPSLERAYRKRKA